MITKKWKKRIGKAKRNKKNKLRKKISRKMRTNLRRYL